MPGPWLAPLLLWTALAVPEAGPAAGAAGAPGLSARERAGKQVYLEGTSPSGGEITAVLGRDTAPLPGAAVACGGCHGADGLGRPEGGVVPPEVTWSSLTRSWGHAHPDGRSHPAFDARGFERAVREGLDPAGNALQATMPRYRMPAQDLADLLAYLRRIEEDHDPGVGASELRIGTVLPTAGRLAEVGLAVRRVLEGSLADLNEGGGIHGRRLVLEVAGYDADREDGLAAAERLAGTVLALVSGLAPGAEAGLARLADRERLPLVGPFPPQAVPSGAGSPYLFQLLPGPVEQARALAEFAARELGPGSRPVAVLAPAGAAMDGIVEAALEQLRRRGQAGAEALRTPAAGIEAAQVRALRRRGAAALLLLGGEADLEALGRAAGGPGWTPLLLLPGPLARGAARLPPDFPGRVFLAFPSAPPDAQAPAAAALARIRERTGLGPVHASAQVSAYAASLLLAEGLRKAGRQLSRERLVASLEGLHAFETGLLPPLRFGPGRRTGAAGASVVALDPATRAFRPVIPWLALD